MNRPYSLCPLTALCSLLLVSSAGAEDLLPSWNDTAAKQAIVEFVERVTNEDSPGYVPPAERIATFDNDGCLWAEQPVYFQLLFAIDRVKALAPSHPEWKHQQPFKAVLEDDREALVAAGKEGLVKLVMASHAGMTSAEFATVAKDWLATSRHPRFERPYNELTYQPMVELLAYLRANEFKTFIVSGGGIEFLRVFAEEAYGIPPEQVVGTTIKTEFEMRDGTPVIVRRPEIDFIDDKQGKPVAINRFIGRRPIFAAGNSDGDLQMLQYTTIARGSDDTTPRFGLIVHHTDAQREWAYDRDSHVGRLDKALDESEERGWTVVDMQRDWRTVFAE